MAESTERGASQQVGLILLFGLVIIGATLVVGVGMVALDGIETQASAERGEQAMLQFDNDLQTAMLDNTSGSVYLEEEGEYNLSDGGDIQITAVNEYANRSETISMGTIRYEDGAGNVFAHQAGGVWRGEGENARVVSKPDIRYYEESNGTDDTNGRLDISVANLSGNVKGGENRVTSRSTPDNGMGLTRDLGFVNYVKITVSGSPYHNAWADFLREEFDASSGDCDPSGTPTETTICHNEGSEEVTVIAPIEGENPFASHVGINPTVYGGLYTEGAELTVDDSITVDRYNSSADRIDDDNVTEDLLVANDGLNMSAGANVTGVPVVNGEFESHNDANLSNIAFATDPGGEQMDVINGTEVYNVTESDPPKIFGAKMSWSFDEIDGINLETDRAIGLIKEYENTSSSASGTLESASDEDGFYYATGSVDNIEDIDTSEGDVHVAVDGDLDLDSVDITGGGQAYFYVSGDIETNDVKEGEKRPRNLWIYGTSSSEVSVEEKFHGVIYAPGSDLTFTDAEIYGSIVGGEVNDIEGDLNIHFDKMLRTDIPVPEENRDVTVEINERRPPLDVTFVLDRSGSMGPSGRTSWRGVTGTDWSSPSFTGVFEVYPHETRNYEPRPIQIKDEDDEIRTIDPGERGEISAGEEIRVEEGAPTESTVYVEEYHRPGNDPLKQRADATKKFIGMMKGEDSRLVEGNQSDQAGVYEFNNRGHEIHHLSDDLSEVNRSVGVSEWGNTDMSVGMEPALDEYVLNGNGNDDAERHMILLSDGENTVFNRRYNSNVETKEQAERAADLNVTIHAVGLGDGVDNEMLETIADETEGDVYTVENDDDLEKIFEGIASNVTATSPTTFEVAPMDEPTTSPNDYSVEVTEQSVTIGKD